MKPWEGKDRPSDDGDKGAVARGNGVSLSPFSGAATAVDFPGKCCFNQMDQGHKGDAVMAASHLVVGIKHGSHSKPSRLPPKAPVLNMGEDKPSLAEIAHADTTTRKRKPCPTRPRASKSRKHGSPGFKEKKPRGRPRKDAAPSQHVAHPEGRNTLQEGACAQHQKKARGRPRKDECQPQHVAHPKGHPEGHPETLKSPRGRPRKDTAQGTDPSNRQQRGAGGRPAARRTAALKACSGSEGDSKLEAQVTGTAAQFSQLLGKVKRAVNRMRIEEHTLHTLGADGWRGTSREKVRLSGEIQRAQTQLAACKEIIRACLKECDEPAGYNARIPDDAFDEEGEIDATEIFCTLCSHHESYDDNDIILCDGSCNRAYHEKCLDPAICAEELPEDEGWLCPACDCKADILDFLNDALECDLDIETMWHEIFPPLPSEQVTAAAFSNRDNSAGTARLQPGCSHSNSGNESAPADSLTRSRPPRRRAAIAAAAISAPTGGGVGAANGTSSMAVSGQQGLKAAESVSSFLALNLPSEDEDDEDFALEPELNAKGNGRQMKQMREQSVIPASAEEEREEGVISHDEEEDEEEEEDSEDDSLAGSELESESPSSQDPSDSDAGGSQERGTSSEDDQVPLQLGRRKRKAVDYVALHAQMFGGSPTAVGTAAGYGSQTDEDFEPESDREA